MQRVAALGCAIALAFACVATANELKIGDKAPDFTVQGVDGEKYSLEQLGKDADIVVVCFTCNQCPVAVAYEDRFIEFNKKFKDKKVAFIAINANNSTEDLDAMKERAEEKGFNFIYAFDESGKVAMEYGAKVTPELFVIKDGKLAYHGAFDDKQKDPSQGYVSTAVESLLAGDKLEVTETKPFGCGIKSKK
jgi:peroxiredoxin